MGWLLRLKDAPTARAIFEFLSVLRLKSGSAPAFDRQRHIAVLDVDHVEALALLADARGRRSSRLDHQRAAGAGHEVRRAVHRRMMGMAGEKEVDARFLDRVERKLVTADGALQLLTHRNSEQGMMRDQHPRGVGIRPCKGFADELELLFADPP